jgi:glycosyltransferase involved in cell wall biosynthesis
MTLAETPARGLSGHIAYLSLEAPVEGQAAHTHIHEMIAELREIGWSIDPVLAQRTGASANAGYVTRLCEYTSLQWHLARNITRYQAIFMRGHFMALPVALYARWRGVPVLHEINGKAADIGVTYRWTRRIAPLIRFMYRAQMRRADRLLAVTDGLKDWAEDFAGHTRATLVSNAANTRVFTPDGPHLPGQPARYVVFVGGLVAWHGIATMIAATTLADWPQDVTLVIAGDGVERSAVQAAASGTPRILAAGRLPYHDVPALLRGALGALCMISDPDGRSATGVAPLKLFEAMACAVPVIVSDLPFQSELVRTTQAGLVVATDDATALAKAVRELATHPDAAMHMGARGAAYVAAHGSWTARARQVDAVLRDVIATRNHG